MRACAVMPLDESKEPTVAGSEWQRERRLRPTPARIRTGWRSV